MKFNNISNTPHKIGDKTIWESRSVAVNCVIVVTDTDYTSEPFVLISKRGPGAADFQGLWNIPAGYLDYDETTSEACVREVWEETNINLYSILNMKEDDKNYVVQDYITKEWGTNSDISNNRQNVSFRYGIYFVMDDFINKLNLSDKNSELNEIGDIKWIPLSKINEYDFAFGHDNLIKIFVNKYVDHKINF
jgi:8-oxo-dGTP pyrophosphatase MutT (NUDIX family)